MHVELVDLFRCPEPHDDSWLVLAADHTRQRTVLDGMLGCPVCGAEYRIENGVTYFGAPPVNDADPITPSAVSPEMSAGQALRAAALLDATDTRATLGFVGESLGVVRAIQGVVAARCIAFDPPDAHDARKWYAASDAPLAVVAGRAHWLASGALSGLWLAPGAAMRGDALRARGRLVAPIARVVPDGFTELARDATQWVAERNVERDERRSAPGGLTQLRRRR